MWLQWHLLQWLSNWRFWADILKIVQNFVKIHLILCCRKESGKISRCVLSAVDLTFFYWGKGGRMLQSEKGSKWRDYRKNTYVSRRTRSKLHILFIQRFCGGNITSLEAGAFSLVKSGTVLRLLKDCVFWHFSWPFSLLALFLVKCEAVPSLLVPQ